MRAGLVGDKQRVVTHGSVQLRQICVEALAISAQRSMAGYNTCERWHGIGRQHSQGVQDRKEERI